MEKCKCGNYALVNGTKCRECVKKAILNMRERVR